MSVAWTSVPMRFLEGLHDPATGGYRSVPTGPVTLYGTCYASLAKYYLASDQPPAEATRRTKPENRPEPALCPLPFALK